MGQRGGCQERPSRTRLCQDGYLWRPRPQDWRQLCDARQPRAQDERGGGRLARRRRFRHVPQRHASRADGQGCCARLVRRRRHLWRDPAPRRHEGLKDDRRNQQGPGGAHLPGGRLRPSRRPLQGRPRARVQAALARRRPRAAPGLSAHRRHAGLYYTPIPLPPVVCLSNVAPFGSGLCVVRVSESGGRQNNNTTRCAPQARDAHTENTDD
mmetsp:Transcript_36234/g.116677  ORF Transcript_36234/g.116677 Transcript_36234/m.116677 type:complete len:211 (+) Transcript_36234:618-1250(+)